VQRQLGDLTAFAQERLGLSGFMVIKAFGQSRAIAQGFHERNQELVRRQRSLATTSVLFNAIGEFIVASGPAALLLTGGYLVVHHALSFPSFIAFVAVVYAYFAPSLHAISGAIVVLLGSTALWDRAFEVLDSVPAIVERPGSLDLSDPRGLVELTNVSFSYPTQPAPAISDVTLRIEPGQLVALVGPSGAGKTTLASLIARFVDPHRGTVAIDGHNVRDLTFASLANAVGIVFQDPFLFHESIKENVAIGRPDASDDEITAALRDAALEDLMLSLPEGLATIVGERGHRLSGGEKQRVAIARVVLQNPPILILDEATSHLDSNSEQLVQEALSRVCRGRTSLVIAHRLSTIVAADLIVVLSRGQIVERGTHEELLRAGGLYAQLYSVNHPAQLLPDPPAHL
jgi:ATP-binding cassette subfamily B protein